MRHLLTSRTMIHRAIIHRSQIAASHPANLDVNCIFWPVCDLRHFSCHRHAILDLSPPNLFYQYYHSIIPHSHCSSKKASPLPHRPNSLSRTCRNSSLPPPRCTTSAGRAKQFARNTELSVSEYIGLLSCWLRARICIVHVLQSG